MPLDAVRRAGGSTPGGSRASSVTPAPAASSHSSTLGANGTSSATNGNGQASSSSLSPASSTRSYRAGCEHLKALDGTQLKTMLHRYAVGVRWGKKVRQGMVYEDEQEDGDEDEEDGYQSSSHGANGHGRNGNGFDGHSSKKRRKLLPHPTCTSCQATLYKPYVCLSCAFTGCIVSPGQYDVSTPITQGCTGKHLASNPGHDFAFEIHSGHLYCAPCQSRVSDPRFEIVHQREKGRAPGQHESPSDTANDSGPMPKDPLSSRIPRGIHNLGATCFLSVILQSFIHNPVLRNYFLGDRHNSRLCGSSVGESCLACEMDKLFMEFFQHDSAPSTPSPWIPSSFLFAVWRAQEGSELSQAGQQDSHELFISVLDALHTSLTDPSKSASSRKSGIPKWRNDNRVQNGDGDEEEDDDITQAGRRNNQVNGNGSDSETSGRPDFEGRLCDCVVHRTFSGVLQSDVCCLVCGYRSSTHDPVVDLSVDLKPSSNSGGHSFNGLEELDGSSFLDVDGLISGKKKKGKNQNRDSTPMMKKSLSKQGSSTASPSAKGNKSGSSNNSAANGSHGDSEPSQDLLDCLRRYCTSERLPPSSYSCPQCGPVEASKQLSLRRLPPVLCIQLKRFEHGGLIGGAKVEAKVRFPLKLDVREFVNPCVLEGNDDDASAGVDDFLYNLFCVIVHEGSLNTGHYWCFAKWQGQWWRLNDAEARPVSLKEVVSMEKAYQLVYVRDALDNVVC